MGVGEFLQRVFFCAGEAETGDVWAVAFGPDGKTVASGSADKMIKLWDAASGKEKATLP